MTPGGPKWHSQNLALNGDCFHQVLCQPDSFYKFDLMTPGWPQMTLKWPSKNFALNVDCTHQVSWPYNSFYLFDLRSPWNDLPKIWLWMLTAPIKFRAHMTVFTNLTSGDLDLLTSDHNIFCFAHSCTENQKIMLCSNCFVYFSFPIGHCVLKMSRSGHLHTKNALVQKWKDKNCCLICLQNLDVGYCVSKNLTLSKNWGCPLHKTSECPFKLTN